MKIIFFLFLISFLAFCNSAKSDSSKIYKKGYKNPLNVLSYFLWNGKKEGNIGLISKVNVQNRNLEATVHPVSIDPSKIKIALSKIKYIDEEKEFTDFIFIISIGTRYSCIIISPHDHKHMDNQILLYNHHTHPNHS